MVSVTHDYPDLSKCLNVPNIFFYSLIKSYNNCLPSFFIFQNCFTAILLFPIYLDVFELWLNINTYAVQ